MSQIGENNPNWKGGRKLQWQMGNEYVMIYNPSHPRASNNYVKEHVLVVEKAMGKYLRNTAPVHHVNNTGTDNSNNNLVACDSQGYHLLLHARQNAINACGNPNWRRCWICQKYDDINNMYKYPNNEHYHHRVCHNNRKRNKYHGGL